MDRDHRLLPGPAGAAGLPRVRTGGGRWLALATTLMLHLLALAGLFLLQPASRTAVGETRELKLFMVEPPEPRPAPPRDKSVDTPRPKPRPAHASVAAKSIEARATQATVTPPTSPSPVSPPAPAAAPPPLLSPPAPRQTQVDTAPAFARYRQVLWARVHDHRPRGAGFSGTVLIRFQVDRNGNLLTADVARGSGSIMLDKLALRSVRQSAPFPPAPTIVPDGDLIFEIPIDFE